MSHILQYKEHVYMYADVYIINTYICWFLLFEEYIVNYLLEVKYFIISLMYTVSVKDILEF